VVDVVVATTILSVLTLALWLLVSRLGSGLH
jgi:hypothetical protein